MDRDSTSSDEEKDMGTRSRPNSDMAGLVCILVVMSLIVMLT